MSPEIEPLRNPGLIWGKPLYRLKQPWQFVCNGQTFVIPRGYEFDGASVPRAFWGWPFGYTPYGVHIGAALEHDWLCDLKPVPSAVAHRHFEMRLLQDGVRPSQAWAMGTAVKLFGPRW